MTVESGAITTRYLGLPAGIYQNLPVSCGGTLPVGIAEVVIIVEEDRTGPQLHEYVPEAETASGAKVFLEKVPAGNLRHVVKC